MEPGVETLGNVLLVVLILLVVIGAGSVVRSAVRSAWRRRKWDFFLSYKSENANEIRRVAERLVAAGYRVWFAEYEIHLLTYEDFKARIKKGIENCSFGILFTTHHYFESEHCRDEVLWLQQRFKQDPRRIIEVSIEEPNDKDRETRCDLGISPESPRLTADLSLKASQQHGDDDLLSRLTSLTGFDLMRGSAAPSCGSGSPRFGVRCAPISFDPSGFVLDQWKTHFLDGTDIVSFKGQPSPVRYSFNVYFHYDPQKVAGQCFTRGGNEVNERKLHEELRGYASWFMRGMLFLRERGLHTIWVDGRFQFALTHSFLWVHMRKYSVILTQLPRPIQIIFTFGVTGSFEDFCRYAPLMERLVQSVRVQDAARQERVRNRFPPIAERTDAADRKPPG